jgi:23S rRNA pseudouridine2457 synthase
MVIAFNKPYGVLSQFTPDGSPNRTLAEFSLPPKVYAAGRLDADSEGLLLLTDEPGLVDRILPPEREHLRTYWAQVERVPGAEALDRLRRGVVIQGHTTLPAKARLLDPAPSVPARTPPIRFRINVPDAWIELILIEGKNRQVRKMTAAVGHPTLRLIRAAIGPLRLADLQPGSWRQVSPEEVRSLLAATNHAPAAAGSKARASRRG